MGCAAANLIKKTRKEKENRQKVRRGGVGEALSTSLLPCSELAQPDRKVSELCQAAPGCCSSPREASRMSDPAVLLFRHASRPSVQQHTDETVFPAQGCGLWGGSVAHTGCPHLGIPGPVPMDAGEEAQGMVRFVCKSFCLLSVLLFWLRGVKPTDLLLFHVLASAISLSSLFGAEEPFLHLLLISVCSLLCIYQENSIPVFLQAADKNHPLSRRTRPVGGWLLYIPLLHNILILGNLVGEECWCCWILMFCETL